MKKIILKPLLLMALSSLCFACQSEQAATEKIEEKEEQTEALKKIAPLVKDSATVVVDTSIIDSSKLIQKAEKPSLSPAKIVFEVTEFDYGTIPEDTLVFYEFHFTNTGERALEIQDVKGSCGCTIGSWPFLPFAKGESGVIKARFDSKGKSGKQENTLTVLSNAENSELVLTLKGQVN